MNAMEIVYLHGLSAFFYIVLLVAIAVKRIQIEPSLWFAILVTVFWLLQSCINNLGTNFYTQNYLGWLLSLFGWLVFLQSAFLKTPGRYLERYAIHGVNVLLVFLLLIYLIAEIAEATKLIFFAAFLISIVMLFYIETIVRSLRPDYRFYFKHLLFGISALSFVSFLNFFNLIVDDEPSRLVNYLSLFIHLAIPVFVWVSVARAGKMQAEHFEENSSGYAQVFLVVLGCVLVIASLLQHFDLYFSQVRSDFYQSLFIIVVFSALGVVVLSDYFRSAFSRYLKAYFYGDRNDYKKEWEKVSLISRDKGKIYDQILDYYLERFKSKQGALYTIDFGELKLRSESGSSLDMDDSILELVNGSIPRRDKILVYDKQGFKQVLIMMECAGEAIGMCRVRVMNQPGLMDSSSVKMLETVADEFAIRLNEIQQTLHIQRQKKLLAFNRTIAFLAHDLKNIAAQQMLAVENFQRFKDDPEFLEDFNETIGHTTQKLNELIAQFRYKSLNSNQKTATLEQIVQFFSQKVRLSNGQIDFDHSIPHRSKELRINTDLLIIVENLLRNAIEASLKGQPIKATMELNKDLLICVADSGKGMSQDFIDNELFEPFATDKKEKGLGIGMFHVKSILNGLNGSINIDSTEGVGTRVNIRIPV